MLEVVGATLKQVEKFKYLGVAFTSDESQDEELDTWIGKVSAVVRALHYLVVMKRELSKKANLFISKQLLSPFSPTAMTERVRSRVQTFEMRFLRRIKGVTLFNKVRSSEIRKSINIEPLFLRTERSQLRCFGQVSKMPQGRLPKQALLAKANGEDQLNKLELDGPITIRILDGIVGDFTRAKWWMWWNTGDKAAWSRAVAPATLTEKRAIKKEEQQMLNILVVTWQEFIVGYLCFSY